MGIVKLRDLGKWSVINNLFTSFTVCDIPEGNWSNAQIRNWSIIKEACTCLQIGMLYTGQPELLYDKNLRWHIAENDVMALIGNSTLDPTHRTNDLNQWGTDGSMIPAAASLFDCKSVTAAVTGNKTVCLKLSGRNISILHGKLIGLITGLIISRDGVENALIHTDHLN